MRQWIRAFWAYMSPADRVVVTSTALGYIAAFGWLITVWVS